MLKAVVDTHVKEEVPAIDVWHGPVDEVPAWPAPAALDHVADQRLELTFDGTDEHGFGYAHDARKEGGRYLINAETIGYAEGRMRSGQKFKAAVTKGHYVLRIESV
jgi:hypothetical protein